LLFKDSYYSVFYLYINIDEESIAGFNIDEEDDENVGYGANIILALSNTRFNVFSLISKTLKS